MPQAGRLRMTWYAAAQLFWCGPALVLFVLDIVGGALAVIVVGVFILLVAIPCTRWLTNLHRGMAARMLGSPVPAVYRPTDGASMFKKVAIWLTDPMTWRDKAWLVATVVLSFTLSLVTLVLFVLVVTGVLWWFGVGPIMTARSRIDRWFLSPGTTERLEQRVEVLTESRAESLDHSAAELRRIERDLHDGAQARMVSLAMSLALAERLVRTDPDAAESLVAEARTSTLQALEDLRTVMHAIHPPVLADRGLGGAVEALALDLAVPVTVTVDLPGPAPAAIESALYFAIAECLANVVKHSHASSAIVDIRGGGDRIVAVVRDDGIGGAQETKGSGLQGIARRLEAFDGVVGIRSPAGGPTTVTLEVPCEWSSPKTSRSSATA
jgi:signal transduction histidine kinase